MPAWRNWYHVSCNTYGTWLPGDPRGWRERKHKKHVDGEQVRPKVGRAKKHAYFNLRDTGFQGTVWEDGSDVVPISGRQHQLNVFAYIRRHRNEGAWVWTFREGIYWPNSIEQALPRERTPPDCDPGGSGGV